MFCVAGGGCAGVGFCFVILGGWGVTRFRGEGGKVGDLEKEILNSEAKVEDDGSLTSMLPPVDYLLDVFDYNIDEDRVFGQQENYRWPLLDHLRNFSSKKASSTLDWLGFAKGDHDDVAVELKMKKPKHKLGRYLPYTYANLVKNIALIFNFGLASPGTAFIGCLGSAIG